MEDNELRVAIVEYLRSNRTTGANGLPLTVSDANLMERLGVEAEQLNAVLGDLIEDGVVHGLPAANVLTSGVHAEWDYLRLAEDDLPSS